MYLLVKKKPTTKPLSFDTKVPWQKIYTGGVGVNDTSLAKFTIPCAGGMISDGAGSTVTNFLPVIWDSQHFRILGHIPGSTISCIGGSFFPVSTSIGFTLYFAFTST